MKKTISILLIVAMMLATVIAIIPASAAPRGTAIKTADDFAKMAADGEYYLENDIVISASYKEDFKGRFDGNGFTISTYTATPVFEKILADARVTNLNIVSSFEAALPAGGDFGALARVAAGTIRKINATINFKFSDKVSKTNIGGLIGQVNGEAKISDVVVRGSIIEDVVNDDGAAVVGGIVGYINANADITLSSCANHADIDVKEAKPSLGGLVGRMQGDTRLSIDKCQNYGDIHFVINVAEHTGIGGILGHIVCTSTEKASLTITDTRNYGDITTTGTKGNHAVGGIAGRGYGIKSATFDGCINSGNIKSTSGGWASTGGIVGHFITYNYTWSKVTKANIKFANCVNTGEVSGGGDSSSGTAGILGGILQANSPEVKFQILTSANYGKISGSNGAGILGIQGTGGGGNKLIIKECYNSGSAAAGIAGKIYQQWANMNEYASTQDKKIIGDKQVGEGEDAKNIPAAAYEIPEITNCVSDSGSIISSYGFLNYTTENRSAKIKITGCVGSTPANDAKHEVKAPDDAAAVRNTVLAKVPGNSSEIDALLDGFTDVVPTDYESGWDEFEAVYNTALEAINKPTAQSVLDQLIPDIEEALENLIAKEITEEDLLPLSEAIEKYAAIKDTEGNDALYTPRTWKAFCNAFDAAEVVFSEADAVDSTIKLSAISKAIKAMDDTFAALDLVPDRTTLEKTFNDYAKLEQGKYVSASWKALQKAITAAKEINDDPNAVAADIAAALKLIKDARSALIEKEKPDSILKKAEDLIAEHKEETYTAKSYNDLNTVVKQIRNAAKLNDMSAADINEFSASLDEAVDTLVLRGNFDEIDALLEPFGEIIIPGDKPEVDTDILAELEEVYTRGSVKNLTNALNSVALAKKKDNLPNFSVNDAGKLLKSLQSAVNGLVAYADYTEIDAKIIEFSALDKTKYTEETWVALETAIKTATDLKYNRNASKPQSDAALEAINAAFAGLVEVQVEEVVVEEKGCKSAIGATLVVMTATLALGATTLLKKKED